MLCSQAGDVASSLRQQMTDYWAQFSEPTLENMMLNEDARQLAEQEETEILDSVPQVNNHETITMAIVCERKMASLADNRISAITYGKNEQSFFLTGGWYAGAGTWCWYRPLYP